MKILLVAPGPRHSTADIFHYYLDAMRDNKDVIVQPFNYHNVMSWQKQAILYYKPELSESEADTIAISRGARELLVDIVTFQPDVVFFISGIALPLDVAALVVDLRNRLTKKFAISFYFTESPYMDEVEKAYSKYSDISFINDPKSLINFDPDGTHHVYYLPHSYNPKIHRPMNEGDNYDASLYTSDVFFTATPFRDRGELLAQVDWSNINFKLGGIWSEFCKPEDYLKLLPHNFRQDLIVNDLMARYYANTKVALNIHRTNSDIEGYEKSLNNHNDAYSIGPRVFESVACGAATLTDFRQEAVDIFDDSISYFETPQELRAQVLFLRDNEEVRRNMITEAQHRIKDCTFAHRLANNILPVFDNVLDTYIRK